MNRQRKSKIIKNESESPDLPISHQLIEHRKHEKHEKAFRFFHDFRCSK